MMSKPGDKIPISKFVISKMNVRADETFGLAEEDTALIQNLIKGSMVQPIIARPEKDCFGIIIGRRRFLAKKKAGAKFLIVGEEVLIKEMTDAEALDDSLRENLDSFRSSLNPVARATALQKLMETRQLSLRDVANIWRLPPANLSDWMQVLKLGKSLQDATARGKILYTDTLKLARMNLPEHKQKELADIAETQPYEQFKEALDRQMSGREKRGIPEGKYEILRVPFDKNSKEDSELFERFTQLAKVNRIEPINLLKDIIRKFLETPHILPQHTH